MTCENKNFDEMNQVELEDAMFNQRGYRWPQVFPQGTVWGNDFSKNLETGGTYLKRFGIDEWLKLDTKFEVIYQERLTKLQKGEPKNE